MEAQQRLDEELEAKYDSFIKELEKQTEQFYTMIENAFASDFREAFINSIKLARKAGVAESEILTTSDDIDSFFMD